MVLNAIQCRVHVCVRVSDISVQMFHSWPQLMPQLLARMSGGGESRLDGLYTTPVGKQGPLSMLRDALAVLRTLPIVRLSQPLETIAQDTLFATLLT